MYYNTLFVIFVQSTATCKQIEGGDKERCIHTYTRKSNQIGARWRNQSTFKGNLIYCDTVDCKAYHKLCL